MLNYSENSLQPTTLSGRAFTFASAGCFKLIKHQGRTFLCFIKAQGQHLDRGRVALTDPSDALAPTLSPVAFQQTSNIPPVPL